MEPTLAALKPVLDNLDLVVRIGLAVLLGGLVGFEREISHQPAGLRTHITLSLGAALFGIISVHGFDAYAKVRADTNYQIDVTRVASQVVVGVGFLGAGAILKDGLTIRGLTTAASLWATAAIGLAAGLGSFAAAGIATAALLLSLVGLRAPRGWVRQRLARDRGTIVVCLVPGASPAGAIGALHEIPGIHVRGLSVRDHGGDSPVIEADVAGPVGADLIDLLDPIGERDDVRSLDIS